MGDAPLRIRESEVQLEAVRSSGAGGQNVNKVETAVTLVHLPSGLAVRAQDERSQGANRRIARQRLAEKLETLARDRAARVRHDAERARRQKARRPHKAKMRMLRDKKHRSGIKGGRGRVRGDE